MRLILTLIVVFFSPIGQASSDIGFQWLVENMDGVQVRGSEALGLPAGAQLSEVFLLISDKEQKSLEQIVTTDICRKNLNGEDELRCHLLIQNKYLIQYLLQKKNGLYRVTSPVHLFVD